MKKSNIISQIAFAWGLGLMSVAPVWAQTCIKTPSCADLGYTKTEADCSGKTILKCPLDNTQVYCPSYEETLRTYKVGDTYIGKDGVGIGTVVQVDSTGKHGVVVTSGGTGDANTATTTCAAKTAGGLNWGIASGDHTAAVASCYPSHRYSGCTLISNDGIAWCYYNDYTNVWYNYSPDCSTDKAYGFYCEASF